MAGAVLDRPVQTAPPAGGPIVAGGGNAMRKVSIRGLLAHKMRFVLTLLAVTLGSAFISGSFVLTHSLGNSIDALAGGTVQNADVVVQAPSTGSAGLPLSLGPRLRRLADVAGTEPELGGTVALLGSNGRAVPSNGAPIQGLAWTEGADSATSSFRLLSGHRPTAPDEVAINDQGLKKAGLRVGDTTRVALPTKGLVPVKVVGSYRFDFSTGGFVGVAFTQTRARAEFAPTKVTSTFYVRGRDGVTQDELRDEVSRAIPAGATAQTQQKYLADLSRQVASGLSFLNTFLLVFGLLGLIVGASLIYITFSMVIAQRLRELALLRAIGTSRGQIVRSVLGEGLLVGLVGSGLGLFLGWGLGWILLQVLGHVYGVPLGSAVLPLTGTLLTLGLGVAVTVLSAVAPAVRAGSTSPIEAMGGQFATPRIGRVRVGFAAGVILLAVVLAVLAVRTGSGVLLGSAVVVSLPTVLVVSPMLAPPLMALFRPLTRLTPVGRLAHGNTIRNPRRTAATAAALALGLALISAVSVLASSSRATLTDSFSKGQNWDFVVSGSTQGEPLPPYVVRAVRSAAGSGSTMGVGAVRLPTRGAGELSAVSVSGDLPHAMDVPMVSGSPRLGAHNLLVSNTVAKSHGWRLGSRVTVGAGTGPRRTLTVTGITQGGGPLDPVAVTRSVAEPYIRTTNHRPSSLFVTGGPGRSTAVLRASLDRAVSDNPLVTVQGRHDYVASKTARINVVLAVLYGLLVLAVAISVLGIVNTLALSVVERVRELGMMRAIGTQRAQIRRMIAVESVMICVYGALIGLGLGVTFGWLLMGQLADDGLTTRVVPWGQIGVLFLAAVGVGLLAAVWPAVKAARTRPLDAIAQE